MDLQWNNTYFTVSTVLLVLFAIVLSWNHKDLMPASIFTVVVAIGVFAYFYEVPYDICTHQEVLTEKISNSYVSMTSKEDETAIKMKYVNENGKETTLILTENTDIYHKKGKENKIVYKETKCHNLLGLRKKSEIKKVTIYKK